MHKTGNVSPAQPVNTSVEVCVSLFVHRYVFLPISLPFVNMCLVECVSICVGAFVFPHTDECMRIEYILCNPALCVCAHVFPLLSFIWWLIHRHSSVAVERPLINTLSECSVWHTHWRSGPQARTSAGCHIENANHIQWQACCKLWVMKALARCSSLSCWTRLSPAESVQSARSAMNCLLIPRLSISPRRPLPEEPSEHKSLSKRPQKISSVSVKAVSYSGNQVSYAYSSRAHN